MDLAGWQFSAALNVALATIRTWIRRGRVMDKTINDIIREVAEEEGESDDE
jgi:hypothetical protein